jgi:ubiquinone/menaquinone biosynthesis C-methylase UbiE
MNSLILKLILVGSGLTIFAALAYWQLIIAEGAYLGQWMVTLLYDLTAHRYDAIKRYSPDMEALFLGKPLTQALAPIEDPLVLDIATGTGRLPIALLEQRSFRGRLVGVDHSRKMLSVAADKLARLGEPITLIWCDAKRLPFVDSTFDMVSCLEMIEFTPDPEAQLIEAVRVLKPGALLVTTRRRGRDAFFMPGHTHSRDAFESMLREIGLVRVEIMAWQVDYDLVMAVKGGRRIRTRAELWESTRCPACGEIAWDHKESALQCRECKAVYPIEGGIVGFAGHQK